MYVRPIYNYRDYRGDRCDHQKKCLPLQFLAGVARETLGLTGDEAISLTGLSSGITPGMTVKGNFAFADGRSETVNLLARIDTDGEADYFKNGGILQYVLRQLAA